MQRFIDDMIETMGEHRGVGLAAPQVHQGLRVFVAALDAGEEDGSVEPVVFINPEVTLVGDDVVEGWEGCLSIPEIRGRVPRAREIKVRGYDRSGERIELEAHDFTARVLQHEVDHLDGVLFIDRMRSFESLTFLDEYSRYWAVKDKDKAEAEDEGEGEDEGKAEGEVEGEAEDEGEDEGKAEGNNKD